LLVICPGPRPLGLCCPLGRRGPGGFFAFPLPSNTLLFLPFWLLPVRIFSPYSRFLITFLLRGAQEFGSHTEVSGFSSPPPFSRIPFFNRRIPLPPVPLNLFGPSKKTLFFATLTFSLPRLPGPDAVNRDFDLTLATSLVEASFSLVHVSHAISCPRSPSAPPSCLSRFRPVFPRIRAFPLTSAPVFLPLPASPDL